MPTSRCAAIAFVASFTGLLVFAGPSFVTAADNWTPIAKFSGSGDKPEDTATFTTHGGRVRFVYSVQPNSSGPVAILLKMYPKGSPVTGNAVIRTQCIDCRGEHMDDIGSGRAGDYYLRVTTSRPWTLRVEEMK